MIHILEQATYAPGEQAPPLPELFVAVNLPARDLEAMRAWAMAYGSACAAAERERIDSGIVYHAAQLILHISPMLHHPPQDDDRELRDESERRRLAALESLRSWNNVTDPDVLAALDDLTKSRGTT